MKLLICADENQEAEIRNAGPGQDISVVFGRSEEAENPAAFDAVFFLDKIPEQRVVEARGQSVIFVGEAIQTNSELQLEGIVRINAWPGFLARDVWEGAGHVTPAAHKAVEMLGRTLVPTADVPGLISARVVSAIINEAWKALEDGVSSKEAIDLAMKLGTNYPYGPFEWCARIGAQRVHALLSHLAATDARYIPMFHPEVAEEK